MSKTNNVINMFDYVDDRQPKTDFYMISEAIDMNEVDVEYDSKNDYVIITIMNGEESLHATLEAKLFLHELSKIMAKGDK